MNYNLKKILLATLLLPCGILLQAQQPLHYKKNIPLGANPTEMKYNLLHGKARYLGNQEGMEFFQDRFGGLPCTLQFESAAHGTPTLYATFRVQEDWKSLEKDYDKLYDHLVKTLGTPTSETYAFLHMAIQDEIDRMQELREGRCDWLARWEQEGGRIQLQLITSPSGECFPSITWQPAK